GGARRLGHLLRARRALLYLIPNDHGRRHQNCNRGGGCRPGERARGEARQELRDAAAEGEALDLADRLIREADQQIEDRRPYLRGGGRARGSEYLFFSAL